MLRRVSELSARARSFSEGKCCGESQEYPLAPVHLPRAHTAGGLRKIARAKPSFKGAWCGQSQGCPFTREHLQEGYPTRIPKTIRSRCGTYQRDLFWGDLGLSDRARSWSIGPCYGDCQDSRFARGHSPNGDSAVTLRLSAHASAPSKGTC